jgi:hypothetical protein
MKVYWAEDEGCVVASANLSTNALGAGNLKEVGVLLPADAVDINQLLHSLNRRPVKQAEMDKLDRDHTRFVARNKFPVKPTSSTFSQWYQTPMRTPWKLGWWDGECAVSQTAKKKSREEYGVSEPKNFITAQRDDYLGGERILLFSLATKSPTQLEWMFCEYVVATSPQDKKAYEKEYPYQAIQVWPLSRYPPCPFRVDSSFRTAFRSAVKQFGVDQIRSAASVKPAEELIELIWSEIQA